MAKRSLAVFSISKASYQSIAGRSFSGGSFVSATLAEPLLHRPFSSKTGSQPVTVKPEEEATGSQSPPMKESAERTVETAFDAAKGTMEKLVDTVVAEADGNVMDTTEYRSLEDRNKCLDSA